MAHLETHPAELHSLVDHNLVTVETHGAGQSMEVDDSSQHDTSHIGHSTDMGIPKPEPKYNSMSPLASAASTLSLSSSPAPARSHSSMTGQPAENIQFHFMNSYDDDTTSLPGDPQSPTLNPSSNEIDFGGEGVSMNWFNTNGDDDSSSSRPPDTAGQDEAARKGQPETVDDYIRQASLRDNAKGYFNAGSVQPTQASNNGMSSIGPEEMSAVAGEDATSTTAQGDSLELPSHQDDTVHQSSAHDLQNIDEQLKNSVAKTSSQTTARKGASQSSASSGSPSELGAPGQTPQRVISVGGKTLPASQIALARTLRSNDTAGRNSPGGQRSRSSTPSVDLKAGSKRKKVTSASGNAKSRPVSGSQSRRNFQDISAQIIPDRDLVDRDVRPVKKVKVDSPEEEGVEEHLFCALCGTHRLPPSEDRKQEFCPEFVRCGASGCPVQVCVGSPGGACTTVIDPDLNTPWYCEHHQTTVINYKRNKDVNYALYKIIVLGYLLVIDLNPVERDTSLNLAVLADTYCAAEADLMCYVPFDLLDPRYEAITKPRTMATDWLIKHPNSDVVIILTTHSDGNGTIEQAIPGSGSQWKSPYTVLLGILGYSLLDSIVDSKGKKLLIALTCGQTFSDRRGLEGWKDLMSRGFDYLLGFLDPLVIRSVVEFIPAFILSLFTIRWSRHGRATPEAFAEAVQTTFICPTFLAGHPIVYAINSDFFRYASPVGLRSPWSLPVPDCGNCGPGGSVILWKPRPERLVYKCQICRYRAPFDKPADLHMTKHGFWRTTMDTYLAWKTQLSTQVWVNALPKSTSLRPMLEDYLIQNIPRLNLHCRLSLAHVQNLSRSGNRPPRTMIEELMLSMEIHRQHWEPLMGMILEESEVDEDMDVDV